jgi:putative ABC transport system permease protein
MLNERRREMAILRAVGASARTVFALLVIESTLLTTVGALIGCLLLFAVIVLGHDYLLAQAGLVLELAPSPTEAWLLVAVIVLGMLAGAIPGWIAYRRSLIDGLQVRL